MNGGIVQLCVTFIFIEFICKSRFLDFTHSEYGVVRSVFFTLKLELSTQDSEQRQLVALRFHRPSYFG